MVSYRYYVKTMPKPCLVLKLSKPITYPRSNTSMGRHNQGTGAVLSPGEEERAEMSHFKTLFQDPSPSQARMSMKGPKHVHFKTPIFNLNTCMVRILVYKANLVPFKTIIHDSKCRNDKMIKISSFQDPLSRPLTNTMVIMAN